MRKAVIMRFRNDEDTRSEEAKTVVETAPIEVKNSEKSDVEVPAPVQEKPKESTKKSSFKVRVKCHRLNVRARHDKTAKIVDSCNFNDIVDITETFSDEASEWGRISGTKNWINLSFTERI